MCRCKGRGLGVGVHVCRGEDEIVIRCTQAGGRGRGEWRYFW